MLHLILSVLCLAAPTPAGLPTPVAVPHPAIPSLKPDREGYCQKTDFVGWSKDGSEAAIGESYCKDPPPDAAWDTLFRLTRDGRIKSWLIGPQAGARLKPETRGRLLFGQVYRMPGARAPRGPFSADAKVDGAYLIVAFRSKNPKVPAPPPVNRALKLPYAKWPTVKPAHVGRLYWSPDGGALAVTVDAVKREPRGGRLEVAEVVLFEIAPLGRAHARAPLKPSR